MLLKTLPLLSGLLLPASAETILGVTVFSRHGDRSSKHYPGYTLTNLGVQQNFQVGEDYRQKYISSESPKQILGISEIKVVNSQIFASAPDQTVLLNTATAFLQGLYPPLEELDPEISSPPLNNGTTYTNPLNGYQYVVLHGEEADAPDTVWLKGDEGCPAATTSMENFEKSAEFQEREEATRSFYQSFWDDAMENVYDFQPSDLSYKNAYEIFDLINVASIHNESFTRNITEDELFQLRTLADSSEFGQAFNGSDLSRAMGAKTFAGAVLNQLNEMVESKGKLKFSLLAGSYDTFLAFFGLSNLTSVSNNFYGLPDYASTMSFELFTPEDVDAFPPNTDDLRVRFLFRNGSDAGAPLRSFPLFARGHEDYMTWADFVSSMKEIAVTSPEQWCDACQSDLLFCAAYGNADSVNATQSGSKGISNAVAGVIGAMVTLGVVAILGAIAFFAMRRRQPRHAAPAVVTSGKGSVHSSETENV